MTYFINSGSVPWLGKLQVRGEKKQWEHIEEQYINFLSALFRFIFKSLI